MTYPAPQDPPHEPSRPPQPTSPGGDPQAEPTAPLNPWARPPADATDATTAPPTMPLTPTEQLPPTAAPTRQMPQAFMLGQAGVGGRAEPAPTSGAHSPGRQAPPGAEPSYPPPGNTHPTPPGQYPQPAYPAGAYAPPQPPHDPAGSYPSGAYPADSYPPGAYPPGASYPSGTGYPPQATPPRRRNGPLVALVIVIALLLCGGTATAGVLLVNAAVDKAAEIAEPITDPVSPTDLPTFGRGGVDPTGPPVTVVYEVTGDGPVDVSYVDEDGPSNREKGVDLPWRKKFTGTSSMVLSVLAFRTTGTDMGELTCRATVDGVEVAKRTVKGSFLAVTCVTFRY
jgi:Mycobacterium membrane protein